MYFGNYGVRNMWLDKCLKSPASEHQMKEPLSYFVITETEIQLENVSYSDALNLRTVL